MKKKKNSKVPGFVSPVPGIVMRITESKKKRKLSKRLFKFGFFCLPVTVICGSVYFYNNTGSLVFTPMFFISLILLIINAFLFVIADNLRFTCNNIDSAASMLWEYFINNTWSWRCFTSRILFLSEMFIWNSLDDPFLPAICHPGVIPRQTGVQPGS